MLNDTGCLFKAALPIDVFHGVEASTYDGQGSAHHFCNIIYSWIFALWNHAVMQPVIMLSIIHMWKFECIHQHTDSPQSAKEVKVMIVFFMIASMCIG